MLMNLLGNLLFSGLMSLAVWDSLYVSFVIPKEAAHPGLAQLASLSIFGAIFIGLFIGNIRVPMSWLAWFVAIPLVLAILMGLRALN
jgi:hypothetical protein